MVVEPGRQILRERGRGEGVGAGAKRTDEPLRANTLALVLVEYGQVVATVHEAFLAGPMRLAQYHREPCFKAPV